MRNDLTFLATGGMILDSVVTADGEVSLEAVGGNAVYAAAGASLWARGVAIAANIPANYPEAHLRDLARSRVRLEGVRRRDDIVTEPEWFVHHEDGSRLDHIYAPSAIFPHDPSLRLSPEARLRWEETLRSRMPEGMTFGGFRARHPVSVEQAAAVPLPEIVHLAPEATPAQLRLARHFRARGVLVSLDPGFAAIRDGLAGLKDLLGEVDLFLPSQRELEALCPGREPAAAMRELRARTPAVIVAKLGGAGSMVLVPGSDHVLTVPALDVPARDPVGAGDAYCGGFSAAFAAGRDPLEAALCGTVSSSFAVESFGALACLHADPGEVARRYRSLSERIEPEVIR